jgi:acyl-CoA reductase-like NAD-dependent aldehyde dehydrogenase
MQNITAGLIWPTGSEITSNTEKILVDLFPNYIDGNCYRVVTGDKNVVAEVLKHPFDHILFAGSARVGKIVMAAAAKHLTPVTLELGGKNPVVISEKANVKLAAKRILWGKYAAAGQTCIAPDYALVHESVAQDFVEALKSVSCHTKTLWISWD